MRCRGQFNLDSMIYYKCLEIIFLGSNADFSGQKKQQDN